MGRKLIAIVAAGVMAGSASALVALAAFSDHGVVAGDPQPSTLLQSSSGSGGASPATAPASPVSGDVAAPAGETGSAARPSQSGGAPAVHGVAPATPQAAAGGHVSVGGTLGRVVTAIPVSSPSASPLGPGRASVPALPAAPLSTPTPTPTPTPATPTPVPASAAPVPSPPPAAPAPLCLLVICLRL
jgi:hypothetical protein